MHDVPQSSAWVDVAQGTKFTQVRTSSGGGTRIVEMADASTYAEICNRAIEIFFPNGKRKR